MVDRLLAVNRLVLFVAVVAGALMVVLQSCRVGLDGFADVERRDERWCPIAFEERAVDVVVPTVQQWGEGQRCVYLDAGGAVLGRRYVLSGPLD